MTPESADKNRSLQTPGRRQALRKSVRVVVNTLPMVAGVLLLAALLDVWFKSGLPGWISTEDGLISVIAATLLGSVAAGHPVSSYVLGGALLQGGVSLAAATALIVSWVTVGVVQLPSEAASLGWRFAATRNGVCFLATFAIAFLTVITMKVIGG